MAFVVREPTRKVHITRILGTNKAGEVLPDIWVDVERFEIYSKATQSWPDNQYQQVITKFRWHDDPDDTEEYLPDDDKGTARNTVVLKVCSPDEDNLEDPEEWVPVRVIKRVHLTHGDEVGSDTNQKYITEDLTARRKVKLRRVYHYDTTIDEEAEAAFDADAARKHYVAKAKDYEKDDATKDDSQYIEIEVITALIKYVSAHPQSNGTDQQVTKHLKNKYLIDETEEALLEEVGKDDKNPPYRLDPFQNIVNVQFKSVDQQWMLGRHGLMQIGNSIWPPPLKADFKDEETEPGVTNGASGGGFTVLAAGCVAYGSVKNGETTRTCFVRSAALVTQPTTQPPCPVYASTVVNGELQWDLVWTAPGPVIALSYANDAFFITYIAPGFDYSRLAVIRDFQDITININPFPTTLNTEDQFAEWGGNVAYNKETEKYACVGAHMKIGAVGSNDQYASNSTFAWSHSTDGLTWSDGMANSFYSGPGMQTAAERTTICAGNGVFVAAAATKHSYQMFLNFDPPRSEKFVIHRSAVAISTDGENWTVVPLPGALMEAELAENLGGYSGIALSQTSCVVFVKDKEFNDPVTGRTGYFVAGDFGGSNMDPAQRYTSMLWTSPDGYNWQRLSSYDYRAPDGVPLYTYWALTAIAKKLKPEKTIVITG